MYTGTRLHMTHLWHSLSLRLPRAPCGCFNIPKWRLLSTSATSTRSIDECSRTSFYGNGTSHGNELHNRLVSPFTTPEDGTRLATQTTHANIQDASKGGKSAETVAPLKPLDTFDPGVYCRDLTALAAKGRLDTRDCRDLEMQRMVEILCKRNKNNVLLIGDAGVGKTALVEFLAQQIADDNVPLDLHKYKLFSLDLTAFFGTSNVEALLHQLITWAEWNRVIIFIDEIHALFNNGSNVANLLKPALARGGFKCIGATTVAEYHQHVAKDRAFERRFQVVKVPEATINETIQMLYANKVHLESFYGLEISNGAIVTAACASARYVNNRKLPDKAFDILDEAATCVKLSWYKMPLSLVKARENVAQLTCSIGNIQRQLGGDGNLSTRSESLSKFLNALHKRRAEAMEDQQRHYIEWQASKTMRKEACALSSKLDALKARQQEYQRLGKLQEASRLANLVIPALESRLDASLQNLVVTSDDVFKVIHQWTGAPTATVDFKAVASEIKRRWIGNDEDIDGIIKYLQRVHFGLGGNVASIMLLGPKSTGKCTFITTLGECIYGARCAILEVDMAQYTCANSFSRLIGSPPGYVGYHQGGLLTEFVSANPNSLVIFKNVQDANDNVLIGLSSIFKTGTLADAKGQVHDFHNSIICATGTSFPKHVTFGKIVTWNATMDEEQRSRLNRCTLERTGQKIRACMQIALECTPQYLEQINATDPKELLGAIDEVVDVLVGLYLNGRICAGDALLLSTSGEAAKVGYEILHADAWVLARVLEASA